MFKENVKFNLYERMQQSTVSPLGENKRGEFLHVIPSPNHRQPNYAKASLDRLGTSSDIATVLPLITLIRLLYLLLIQYLKYRGPIITFQFKLKILPYENINL